jgi:type III secretion system low calcium response chaperone LcrH/SycD
MKAESKPLFDGIEFKSVDQIVECLEEVRGMIIDGYLEEVLGVDTRQNEDIMAKFLGENFDYANLKAKVESAVQKAIKGGISLKHAFGISSEGLEAFYFMGHAMFKRRNYPAARRVFEFLIQLDSVEPKYYHALASTQHRQKDFFAAAQNYMSAHVLSPVNNPELHYHAADCYIYMDDLMSAILSLGHCVEGCDDRNEIHRQIKARALTMRQALIVKLQEREQASSQAQADQNAAREKGKQLEEELRKSNSHS